MVVLEVMVMLVELVVDLISEVVLLIAVAQETAWKEDPA